MRKYFGAATILLLSLLVSTPTFSQSQSGAIGGAVSDTTGALIPGVTISATNTDTGIVATALSNEAGVYNFASLQPGKYKVSAVLTGFQTSVAEVPLAADALRLNFTLKIAAAGATTVEVTTSVDTLLAQSSPSIGEVLSQQKVSTLPLISNNVLDLIGTMSGVNVTNSAIFGANNTTFAGLDATNINVRVNGVTSTAGGRYPTGVQTATMINPDMVGEIKLILTPVDAESGDGNGQIQIQTRSGTNKYSGSVVGYSKNTALNANTWSGNRNTPPTKADWANVNQLTGSFGGPIIKNKTFFFVLYDNVWAHTRTSVNSMVLTPCARNGIFRYFDTGLTSTTGTWNNGNIRQITTAPGNATPTIAVVDALGNPLAPGLNPDGVTPFTGKLRYVSAFGPVTTAPTKADCSDAVVGGTTWDPFRKALDTTGFVTKLNNAMPLPNNYETGDGLNTAGIRWTRTLHGSDNLFGIGDPLTERKQINVKIDHNFSQKERMNVSMQYEHSGGDDYYMLWPDTFEGANFRHPQTWTAQMTSTLTSNMVNEGIFGYSVTGGNNISPLKNPNNQPAINDFYNLSANGVPVIPQLGVAPPPGFSGVDFRFNQPMGNRGIWPAYQTDKTPLWTLADNLSWTRGAHAFKFGVEGRLARSLGKTDGGFGNAATQVRPIGGDTLLAPIAANAITATNVPGLGGNNAGGNNLRLRHLLDYLSGSLSSVNQFYFLQSAGDTTWQDIRTAETRALDYHQNSYDFFIKDDWKIRKDLTLNLGVRYEKYGVPFIAHGLTVAPDGGGYALFGISGHDGFTNWMNPGPVQPGAVVSDPALLTTLQFVGPGSPNAGTSVWRDDRNNWGPAVGFAWQLPFFGEGKTTVRGGYQITYQGTVQVNTLDSAIGNAPGTTNQQAFAGDASNPYLDLARVMSTYTPVPVTVQPMQAIPIGATGVSFNAYDPNYVSPYVQNYTFSVTRSVRSNLTVDVRYVGNIAVKQNKSINLNSSNFLYNGLKEQFDSIRAGGEAPLLDQMLGGINITGAGAIGTPAGGTAASQMRASTTFNTNLANGNYSAVAGSLATLSYTTANNPTLPVIPNGQTVGSALRNSGLFPANFIQANPQFTNATYNTNLGHSNYQSMEVQTTFRPIQGVTWQGTYTFSKNLGTPGTFTNPVERSVDGYQLIGNNPFHQFRSNGAIELPIGPNKLVLGNSSGVLARIVEHWETNFIYNLATGIPTTIPGATTLYANGRPDEVSPFPYDLKGNIWNDGAASGSYFPAGTFGNAPDPQCASVGGPAPTGALLTFHNLCTLQALTDAKTGNIILQNAQPGKQGTMGVGKLQIAGTWTLDANIGKRFRISESKSLQFRFDATNMLNHPSPVAPSLALGGTTPFGSFNNKSTNARVFQGQLRFSF